jgi:hypothetical protein
LVPHRAAASAISATDPAVDSVTKQTMKITSVIASTMTERSHLSASPRSVAISVPVLRHPKNRSKTVSY